MINNAKEGKLSRVVAIVVVCLIFFSSLMIFSNLLLNKGTNNSINVSKDRPNTILTPLTIEDAGWTYTMATN